MSQRRRVGVNTFFKMLLEGKIIDTHHLVAKEKGGSNKKSNKMKGDALEHRLWHFFVKNSSSSQGELDEVADKFSKFIRRNSRFFAITKGESIYKTIQKINQFLGDGDFKIKVVYKQSKVIQFRPKKNYRLLFPKIVS